MKNVINTASLVLLSAGCTFAQTTESYKSIEPNSRNNSQITVEGERKLNTDFKKYKTFGWLESDRKLGNQIVEYTYAEVAGPSSTKAERKEERREEKNMSKSDRKTDKKMVKDEKKMGKRNKNGELVIYSYSFVMPSEDSTINNTVKRTINEELEGRGYRKDNTTPDLLVAYKIFDRNTQIKGYNAPPTELNGNSSDEVHQPQDTVTYALRPGTVLITLIDAKTSGVVWEGFASGVAQNNDLINDKMRVKEAINLIFKKYEFRGDKYSMNN